MQSQNLLTLNKFEQNIDDNNYQQKIEKLLNPYNKDGKYMYDLTYQSWVIENSLTEAQKKKKTILFSGFK